MTEGDPQPISNRGRPIYRGAGRCGSNGAVSNGKGQKDSVPVSSIGVIDYECPATRRIGATQVIYSMDLGDRL